MKIYANFSQEVEIDPQEVIRELIQKKIGSDWIFEEDEKYFRGFEVGAGSHSFNLKKEIEEEEYKYIKALQLILYTLES